MSNQIRRFILFRNVLLAASGRSAAGVDRSIVGFHRCQLHASAAFASANKPENPAPEPECYDMPDSEEISIPPYQDKVGESVAVLRSRLQYQSRKRGTLENGLLLSSFASRYLSTLNPDQLVQYDRLINKPTNDWDIYYWIVETKPTPAEFENEVMSLLRDHAKNKGKEMRITQPELFHN